MRNLMLVKVLYMRKLNKEEIFGPVINFGKENEGISSAPFLIKTIEEMDNEIKFVVALPVSGEKVILTIRKIL